MRRVMHGAFILTIASFIAKVLSALYRIPLQNLVGDEGFYVDGFIYFDHFGVSSSYTIDFSFF